jgi:hypothetical protein
MDRYPVDKKSVDQPVELCDIFLNRFEFVPNFLTHPNMNKVRNVSYEFFLNMPAELYLCM